MDADAIEKCNDQYLNLSASISEYKTITCYCSKHAEQAYIIQHAGEKCCTPSCNNDLTARENLPQLCERCNEMFQMYGLWLQNWESSGDLDSTRTINLSDSSFSVTCSVCKMLEQTRDRNLTLDPSGLKYGSAGSAFPSPDIWIDPHGNSHEIDQRHEMRFTPLGIIISGTPYLFTHSWPQHNNYSAYVSWIQIRSWIASCDDTSKHHATDLQFRSLLSLDPWFVDVDDRRLIRMSSNLNIMNGSPTDNGVVYAALSYVWGGSKPMLLRENLMYMQQFGVLDLPSACSQTIRDAMLICRRTGIRYLWVGCQKREENTNKALS